MKERLIQLLDLEQLSPSKFADLIGVQRSSISHVISGRNKPSFDFIQKTLTAFPGLNAEWLILGQGTMYEQMGRATSGNLFEPVKPVELPFPDKNPDKDTDENLSGDSQELNSVSDSESDRLQPSVSKGEAGMLVKQSAKKVVQVMVFYEDDTFRSYIPSQ